jgi:hypothetical protein
LGFQRYLRRSRVSASVRARTEAKHNKARLFAYRLHLGRQKIKSFRECTTIGSARLLPFYLGSPVIFIFQPEFEGGEIWQSRT